MADQVALFQDFAAILRQSGALSAEQFREVNERLEGLKANRAVAGDLAKRVAESDATTEQGGEQSGS